MSLPWLQMQQVRDRDQTTEDREASKSVPGLLHHAEGTASLGLHQTVQQSIAVAEP